MSQKKAHWFGNFMCVEKKLSDEVHTIDDAVNNLAFFLRLQNKMSITWHLKFIR
jgi:hypothetical protein